MKSAEEIAEEVWEHLHKALFIALLKEARNAALDGAAKVAENVAIDSLEVQNHYRVRDAIIKQIRALKKS